MISYRQWMQFFIENLKDLIGRSVFDVVVNSQRDDFDSVFQVRLGYRGVIHVYG